MNRHDLDVTMDQAINGAFRHQRKKGGSEADKLRTWFENYYESDFNENILSKPLNLLIENVDYFTARMEAGLRSFPNDKSALAARLLVLLQYINDEYHYEVDLSFLQNFTWHSREERLLQILKYLHDGNNTRAEIAETFGISERALSQDLKVLQDGFDFMGCTMKIRELERGSNTYTSLIHPLFLTMRTDEIFSLTVGLKLLSRGTIFENSHSNIADIIYKQLSPYAQKIVDQHSSAHNITYTDREIHFLNSFDMMRKEQCNLPYFLKEPIPCEITYKRGSKLEQTIGTLHFVPDDEHWQQILIRNDIEEVLIEVGDIIKLEKLENISD